MKNNKAQLAHEFHYSFTDNFGCDLQQLRSFNEESELHPSIVTLCRDPYKYLPIKEASKSRVVCASLETKDHGQEDKELKE